MKDLSIYFQSIDSGDFSEGELGHFMQSNETSFPDIEPNGIALFYVPEHRGLGLENKKVEKLNLRSFLKKLKTHNCKVPIYDLGDLHPGQTIEDTYFAVTNVVEELMKFNVLPIVIGGGQDLTFAQYKAYERLEQTINITAIDPKFDLGTPDGDLTTDDFLSQIITHKPCYLFNYSNLGYQTYLIEEKYRLPSLQQYFYKTSTFHLLSHLP